MPYCPNCGTSVSDDARVCSNCSYPLDKARPVQPQPPPAPPAQDPYGTPYGQPPQPAGQPQYTGQQPPYGQPMGGGYAPSRTDGQATAALVLGILGFLFCPFIFSIIAIVLGKQSMNRIEQSGGMLQGYGMAKAGWILGIVGIVLAAIGLGFFILLGSIGTWMSF